MRGEDGGEEQRDTIRETGGRECERKEECERERQGRDYKRERERGKKEWSEIERM